MGCEASAVDSLNLEFRTYPFSRFISGSTDRSNCKECFLGAPLETLAEPLGRREIEALDLRLSVSQISRLEATGMYGQ